METVKAIDDGTAGVLINLIMKLRSAFNMAYLEERGSTAISEEMSCRREAEIVSSLSKIAYDNSEKVWNEEIARLSTYGKQLGKRARARD